MTAGRVDQADLADILGGYGARISQLENGDGSFPWIYVQPQADDPSPPSPGYFQNGCSNVNPDIGVRFKRVLSWLFLEGGDGIAGYAPNVAVFQLPVNYFNPNRNYPLLASLADGSGSFTYKITNTGLVVYINQGAY